MLTCLYQHGFISGNNEEQRIAIARKNNFKATMCTCLACWVAVEANHVSVTKSKFDKIKNWLWHTDTLFTTIIISFN